MRMVSTKNSTSHCLLSFQWQTEHSRGKRLGHIRSGSCLAAELKATEILLLAHSVSLCLLAYQSEYNECQQGAATDQLNN